MHQPLSQSVFIHRQYFGEVVRPAAWQTWDGLTLIEPPSVNWGFQCQRNYALVCPTCLEAWAVLDATNGPTSQASRAIFSHPCERHPSPDYIAGSLFPSFLPASKWRFHDPALFWYLPAALLARELSLHLQHFERYGYDKPF
jgi:hypothetical protein